MIKIINCEVCSENQHKYKCPSCRTKYCSVSCCKKHKEDCIPLEKADKTPQHLSMPPPPPQVDREDGEVSESDSDTEKQTEDKVPLDRLKLLGQSPQVKVVLENPHLRDMMISLDHSDNPSSAITSAMQTAIFTEFADSCLQIVEGQQKAGLKLNTE